jgi:hypothetical protein
MGQSHTKMVMRARNVGPCKPAQRPGDLVLPNGQTMNMHDMMNAHGAQGTIRPPASPPRTPR